ncbi:hypothetical protein DUNSADRAFT_8227 [Dunaliella salina]|uniref:Uncharacterized protein n=1 Tax=Dunaliella salina TaxID=3046 RepID=A0ABQ7HA29_DUNSA|nr:hypothetical protein DUNSADRAFT_8227 [Dunaliella salina]|eukprot:KAF5843712.1 hypothetical protein DUNSADRAFT_8227 [Dunaliella salina]
MGPQAELPEPGYFEHTHLGCYICATLTGLACCVGSYNNQGTWLKIQSARGYWVLTALLATFAYLYVRPFIRFGIGSASRGYINFTSLYIVWLIGAVFYHLPSLESMGVNIKADVSLMIVISLGSLVVLIALWFVHVLMVQFKLLTPKVSLAAGAWSPKVLSSLLLNSVVLGAMCSTYHSFCGNGLLKGGGISSLNAGSFNEDGENLKSAVCAKWLHPILTSQYPWFSSFMLFGEGGDDDVALGSLGDSGGHNFSASYGTANKTCPDEGGVQGPPASIGIDFPWDGIGVVWVPAGNVLSPVLTMWITLIALYIANTVADNAAVEVLQLHTCRTVCTFHAWLCAANTVANHAAAEALNERLSTLLLLVCAQPTLWEIILWRSPSSVHA